MACTWAAAWVAICLALLSATGARADGFDELASWVRQNDGRIDRRLEVRADENGLRGVFAKAMIQDKTEVMVLPWSLVIGNSSWANPISDLCGLVSEYQAILERGDDENNFHQPYASMEAKDIFRHPALWTEETRMELQGLPPQDTSRHVDWFLSTCEKGPATSIRDLPLARQRAFIVLISRASDRGLIPGYDLLNHHNGLLNVRIETRKANIALVTVKKVHAGEQLYLSYGSGWSHEIFRDYGFVEEWPQLWGWPVSPFEPDFGNNKFLVLPGEVVELLPPKERTISSLPLEQRIEHAKQWTAGLLREDCMKFKKSAENLLASLPTTADEDEIIIQEMTAKQDALDNEGLDVVDAVRYRLAFKRAVQLALKTAQAKLENDGGTTLSRDEL